MYSIYVFELNGELLN